VTSPHMLPLITALVMLAAALLAWVAIDVGTGAIARYQKRFTSRTKFQVREFFLVINPTKLFAAHLAAMCLGTLVAGMLTGSVAAAACTLVGLALLPRWLYAWLRARRLRRFEEQLPDALMMLAGALRAGLSLSSAIAQLVLEAPAPLGQEFTLLLREQRMGGSLEQSLNGLALRVPTQTTILTVSSMRIASETGGGLAEMLERTADTVRGRIQIEGKIRALTAQGKLQAAIVGLLPLVLMFALNYIQPVAMATLWHTRMGWATLGVIALLEVLGVYVIRKIVAIDV
jgi:tight adherence protein B